MRYQAIQPSVEAAGVVLADRQHFAVLVGDGAVVVPAAAFLALYELADPVMGPPQPQPQRPYKKRCTAGARFPSPLADAIMGVIQAESLTTAEVCDHVMRRIGSSRKSVTSRLSQLEKAGRVEKREQPETRLDKWYVTGGL